MPPIDGLVLEARIQAAERSIAESVDRERLIEEELAALYAEEAADELENQRDAALIVEIFRSAWRSWVSREMIEAAALQPMEAEVAGVVLPAVVIKDANSVADAPPVTDAVVDAAADVNSASESDEDFAVI
jgi:hypothetical protein